MKIAIFPYIVDSPNKYIDRMVEAINCAFPSATISSFPRNRNILSIKGYDYVWLNWFENLPSNTNKFKQFIIKISILSILKILKIRSVVTLHNRMPHDSIGSLWERMIFNATFHSAHKILILSSDSKDILKKKYGEAILKKVVLVPHPTYNCLPKNISKDMPFSILFFGYLRPYKNIEMIFELAKYHPEIPFTIAGNALNKEYENTLLNKSANIPNITLLSRFLTSEEIDNLIDVNSILLLPYNIKSSLNSGVVIHAICKKINMIVPEIGTVNQLKNKNKIFSYTYDSPKSHFNELNKMIEYAKDEYENNFDKFNNRINVLYEEIISTQSPEALSTLVFKVFKDIDQKIM